jgi:CBS domain-containing protein
MLDTAAARRIPVCTRLVVIGPYKVLPTSWVPCPRKGGADLATCLDCPRYEGLAPGDRGATVSCHPGVAGPGADLPPTAAEVMSRDVFCVGGDVEIGLVASLLVETGLHTVPVVNEAGCPLGMLSMADLIRAAGHDDTRPAPERQPSLVPDRPSLTARDVMRRITVGARPDDTLTEVAARMRGASVDHVPVLDDDGRLVGMVTPVDIARWSARHVAS